MFTTSLSHSGGNHDFSQLLLMSVRSFMTIAESETLNDATSSLRDRLGFRLGRKRDI